MYYIPDFSTPTTGRTASAAPILEKSVKCEAVAC